MFFRRTSGKPTLTTSATTTATSRDPPATNDVVGQQNSASTSALMRSDHRINSVSANRGDNPAGSSVSARFRPPRDRSASFAKVLVITPELLAAPTLAQGGPTRLVAFARDKDPRVRRHRGTLVGNGWPDRRCIRRGSRLNRASSVRGTDGRPTVTVSGYVAGWGTMRRYGRSARHPSG
jgi:hypothetical protein